MDKADQEREFTAKRWAFEKTRGSIDPYKVWAELEMLTPEQVDQAMLHPPIRGMVIGVVWAYIPRCEDSLGHHWKKLVSKAEFFELLHDAVVPVMHKSLATYKPKSGAQLPFVKWFGRAATQAMMNTSRSLTSPRGKLRQQVTGFGVKMTKAGYPAENIPTVLLIDDEGKLSAIAAPSTGRTPGGLDARASYDGKEGDVDYRGPNRHDTNSAGRQVEEGKKLSSEVVLIGPGLTQEQIDAEIARFKAEGIRHTRGEVIAIPEKKTDAKRLSA